MTKVKSALLITALFFISQITKAQNDVKTYDFTEFDKVQIQNINGDIEIEIGKSYSITVSGNEHAQKQVHITKSEGKLLVSLVDKFLNDWKNREVVKVKIVMPEISNLFNYSNADVSIQKFAGRYFGIENKGNGNVLVSGSVVEHIELNNNGNGNLETRNIISKGVNISKAGNGDVSVRTDTNFYVEMNGNGDIVNYGNGKAIIKKQSGTGKVLYRN